MGYRCLNVRINRVNDASISWKNVVNFGPVTPELKELILVRHGKKLAYLVKHLRIYWTDFLQSFHQMKALYTDDGSEPYFPICQGTLP